MRWVKVPAIGWMKVPGQREVLDDAVVAAKAVRSPLLGFRQFITRGNVVDLAVAVVVGTAFTAVVQSLVKNIFTPLIAAIFGKPDFSPGRSETRPGRPSSAVSPTPRSLWPFLPGSRPSSGSR